MVVQPGWGFRIQNTMRSYLFNLTISFLNLFFSLLSPLKKPTKPQQNPLQLLCALHLLSSITEHPAELTYTHPLVRSLLLSSTFCIMLHPKAKTSRMRVNYPVQRSSWQAIRCFGGKCRTKEAGVRSSSDRQCCWFLLAPWLDSKLITGINQAVFHLASSHATDCPSEFNSQQVAPFSYPWDTKIFIFLGLGIHSSPSYLRDCLPYWMRAAGSMQLTRSYFNSTFASKQFLTNTRRDTHAHTSLVPLKIMARWGSRREGAALKVSLSCGTPTVN